MNRGAGFWPGSLLVTCEHGGNDVPAEFAHLFCAHQRLLATHRGYDLGILPVAQALAQRLKAPLQCATVTRLLVDLNRSTTSRTLFSEVVRELDETMQADILDRYYRPYREEAIRQAGELIAGRAPLLHLSLHSFTPVLHGVTRNAGLGLLYDPRRAGELALARAWQQAWRVRRPDCRVRLNYPYRGKGDGLVKTLRDRHGADRYLGFEIELNQALLGDASRAEAWAEDLVVSLRQAAAVARDVAVDSDVPRPEVAGHPGRHAPKVALALRREGDSR